MENLNLAVIFYSATGTNYAMAQEAEKAAKDLGVKNVKLLRIEEKVPKEIMKKNEDWIKTHNSIKDLPTASADDLEWADAIIFSAPTRYGNLPSQFSSFIDTTGPLWQSGKLVNKVVSGMTSAGNPNGGQEGTLMSLYKSMMHWGAIVAAPGYANPVIFETGGNPYGFSMTAGNELSLKGREAIQFQVKRTLQIAEKIK
ncbi:NAD(P)H-dependent oxidoreductase [Zunongwangia sp.]|uniref:NAD(P)H-dependent oxidoreductase n=1 Tax=Zunongwangia sp. TaxID=1965325 RepID=UPI003AA890A2